MKKIEVIIHSPALEQMMETLTNIREPEHAGHSGADPGDLRSRVYREDDAAAAACIEV
jgi:hypothetical protein